MNLASYLSITLSISERFNVAKLKWSMVIHMWSFGFMGGAPSPT